MEQADCAGRPTISFHALCVGAGYHTWRSINTFSRPSRTDMTTLCRKRARQTIEDFVQTYLPYHGLGADHFLEWWDILVWVEGTIYGLDERNEDILAAELGVEASPAAVEEDDWLAQGARFRNVQRSVFMLWRHGLCCPGRRQILCH